MFVAPILSDFLKTKTELKSRQEQASQGHLGRKTMAVLENNVLLFTQVEGSARLERKTANVCQQIEIKRQPPREMARRCEL